MRKLFFALFCFSSFATYGQELIRGMVADSATFAPLPFVNVYLKNKNKGTITDMQGNFKIVGAETDTLVLSFIGYNTIELPLEKDWQPSLILLSEKSTLLNTLTIEDKRIDPYGDMFDEQNEALREQNKRLPFYYSRGKKQKIRIGRLETENVRVRTYVEVIIQNEDNKKRLMQQYQLTEEKYYDLLADFNARNYTVMYYLTAGELVSLLNNFFRDHAQKK